MDPSVPFPPIQARWKSIRYGFSWFICIFSCLLFLFCFHVFTLLHPSTPPPSNPPRPSFTHIPTHFCHHPTRHHTSTYPSFMTPSHHAWKYQPYYNPFLCLIHTHFLSTCMKPCMELCISTPFYGTMHITTLPCPPYPFFLTTSLYTTFIMPTFYPHAWNHAYHHPPMPTLPILSYHICLSTPRSSCPHPIHMHETMHITTLLYPPYPSFLTTFLSLHHVLHAHFLPIYMKPCMEPCISPPSHAHLTHSFINLSLIPHLHFSCLSGTIPPYPYQHPLTHSLIILSIPFSLTYHLSHFPNLHHSLH